MNAGFDRAELSFLASAETVEEKLRHAYQKVSDIADDPEIPRAAYVSTEEIGDAKGGLIGGLVYVGALVAAGAVVVSDGSLASAFAAAAVSGGAGGDFGFSPSEVSLRLRADPPPLGGLVLARAGVS